MSTTRPETPPLELALDALNAAHDALRQCNTLFNVIEHWAVAGTLDRNDPLGIASVGQLASGYCWEFQLDPVIDKLRELVGGEA